MEFTLGEITYQANLHRMKMHGRPVDGMLITHREQNKKPMTGFYTLSGTLLAYKRENAWIILPLPKK
ncbi:MAG: hypothetical protein AABY11_00430 [archaeon]